MRLNPHGLVDWLGAVLGLGFDRCRAASRPRAWTYTVAGVASLALAAFSLVLPHTPPKKASESAAEKFAWLEALKLLKHPFVLVLWLVTFVDSFVLYCYFNWTGVFLGTRPAAGGVGIPGNWIMPVMSIGQIAEMLTMLILGATLKRLGWRRTMVIGILGHVGAVCGVCLLPAMRPASSSVQLLHGICYAFFFATVYIFADAYFPKDVRASAQGLFNVMVLGMGALAGQLRLPLSGAAGLHPRRRDRFSRAVLVPMALRLWRRWHWRLFFHPPPKAQPVAEIRAAVPA